MTELLSVLVGFGAGAGLGFAVFGGLLVTLRRLPDARRPATLMFLSWFARLVLLALVLTGLAVMGGWIPVAAAVPGVLAARAVFLRSVGEEGT